MPKVARPKVIGAPISGPASRPGANRPTTIGVEASGGSLGGGKKLKFATQKALPGRTAQRQGEHKQSGSDGKQNGMVFNKGHGQHILRNPLVVTAIIEKAAIKSTDVVLEIGPGTGNLTEKLLEHAKKVIAFEIDPRMVTELHKRFQHSPHQHKLQVIKGNCLDHEFPYFDKCVANVPYAISSALVFKLLRNPTFKCAVLMFQREFALRVCATPGSEMWCRLSVNSQLLAKCSHLMKISKNSFNPPPKVESSVIRLDPFHPPPPVSFEEWDGLVKLLFNRKNKKASAIFRSKSTLKSLYEFHCSYSKMEQKEPLSEERFKDLIFSILQDEDVFGEEGKRSRTMTIEDIMMLLNHFHQHGVHFA